MTHPPQFTGSREAIQLLAEHGLDGLAAALELLLNEVMKLERTEVLRNCSGEISRIAASPRRTLSRASWRSGSDNSPLIVTAEAIPARASPCTWSAISATRGEITTVNAPVLSNRESAGIW